MLFQVNNVCWMPLFKEKSWMHFDSSQWKSRMLKQRKCKGMHLLSCFYASLSKCIFDYHSIKSLGILSWNIIQSFPEHRAPGSRQGFWFRNIESDSFKLQTHRCLQSTAVLVPFKKPLPGKSYNYSNLRKTCTGTPKVFT